MQARRRSRSYLSWDTMAKAYFHKNQRVYVKPVGTWAQVERVNPQWAKGVEEPIKVTYDCGMGRDFGADELVPEDVASTRDVTGGAEQWRLVRGQNKWRSEAECANHPFPGTYPVVVTGDRDWGGWRVPGAEYDLDPLRIEFQAKVIANALECVDVLRKIHDHAEESPENVSDRLADLMMRVRNVLKEIES